MCLPTGKPLRKVCRCRKSLLGDCHQGHPPLGRREFSHVDVYARSLCVCSNLHWVFRHHFQKKSDYENPGHGCDEYRGDRVLHSRGGPWGIFAPIVDADQGAIAYADPVPQAVILTAIVIGFSIQALMLVGVMKLSRDNPTLETSEIEKSHTP